MSGRDSSSRWSHSLLKVSSNFLISLTFKKGGMPFQENVAPRLIEITRFFLRNLEDEKPMLLKFYFEI